jgi:hypothetical protein
MSFPTFIVPLRAAAAMARQDSLNGLRVGESVRIERDRVRRY